MEEKILYGCAEFTEERGNVKTLKYYLTQAPDSHRNRLYGLQTEIWEGDLLLEACEAPLLTYSKELAEGLLARLYRCKITPLCLEEVVDDFLGAC